MQISGLCTIQRNESVAGSLAWGWDRPANGWKFLYPMGMVIRLEGESSAALG